MLVKFKSTATESITMFGNVAEQLIKMMGMSGVIPSAIAAKDISAAVEKLQSALQAQTPSQESADEERDAEPPVALATRALPLIDLLRRAAAKNAPVMWEKA